MEDIIDLKSKLGKQTTPPPEEKNDFEIHHISKGEFDPLRFTQKQAFRSANEDPNLTKSTSNISTNSQEHPSKTIEVDFGMFSELVSNPNSQKIIRDFSNEKISMSANLLTKLASTSEEKSNNKLSIIFCIGLIIGITFAWVLLNEF